MLSPQVVIDTVHALNLVLNLVNDSVNSCRCHPVVFFLHAAHLCLWFLFGSRQTWLVYQAVPRMPTAVAKFRSTKFSRSPST
eukprot:SAG11_NODE_5986_length_1418_cov_1.430629_1_plen_82_part_00